MTFGKWRAPIALLGTVAFGLAWAAASDLKRFEYKRVEMGTLFRIVLHATDEGSAGEAANRAFERVEELDALLSDYRADSELSRVCAQAFAAPQVVSPELFHLLRFSIDLSRRTEGRFDVTVAPLSELWRRSRREGRLPKPDEIASRRERVGYRDLLLNPLTRSVRFGKPGMGLDLGAIAKGYAADEAVRVLTEAGLDRALVDAGGDIRVTGPPPKRGGWRIAIETGAGQPLLLRDQAVATSGDDFQALEVDGKRYSHIVDPTTGIGLTSHRLVTVIAPDATTADALATALSLCPVEEGLKLADESPGTSARIEDRIGKRVWYSGRFPK